MADVLSYLNSKNIEFRQTGNEAVIRCLHCGKKKLSINIDTGKFQCFYCKAKEPNSDFSVGHISKLMEKWGDIIALTSVSDKIEPNKNQQERNYIDLVDRYHYELMKSKKALRYLAKRGITEESVKRFKLGFTRRYGQDWLAIPSFEDNIPKLLKFRKLPPDENEKLDKYIREEGSKSILFNGDVLKKNNIIFIAEGELDAITAIQNGYENTIGITGGAGTLLPEWYDQLIMVDKLILILDPDEVGQNAARDIWAERLGVSRCWNVKLPEDYDINKYFQDHTKEEFNAVLNQAYQFKVNGVVSLKEALYDLYRQREELKKAYALPWENVNKLMGGGLKKSRLYVLGGQAAAGKTSMSLQILHHLAINYNIPSLTFCMEMPHTSLATKIVQVHHDLCYEEINPDDALTYAIDLEKLPLYFGYSPKITPDIFYNTAKEARNRYGCQAFVFDNLQLLVRSDKESDIAKASKLFKEISMDLNVIMILISQPRKLNSESIPTFDDLKASSAIAQDADNVILIHRKRLSGSSDTKSSFDPIANVIVDKDRFAPGGRTKLELIGAKSKFVEVLTAYENPTKSKEIG